MADNDLKGPLRKICILLKKVESGIPAFKLSVEQMYEMLAEEIPGIAEMDMAQLEEVRTSIEGGEAPAASSAPAAPAKRVPGRPKGPGAPPAASTPATPPAPKRGPGRPPKTPGTVAAPAAPATPPAGPSTAKRSPGRPPGRPAAPGTAAPDVAKAAAPSGDGIQIALKGVTERVELIGVIADKQTTQLDSLESAVLELNENVQKIALAVTHLYNCAVAENEQVDSVLDFDLVAG